MAGKKCFSCFISILAAFLFFWYLLDSIRNTGRSIWISAIVLTVLINIAVVYCPVFRGYKCIGKFFSKEEGNLNKKGE